MLSWDEVRLDEGRAAPCILHCPSALSFALENPKLSALSLEAPAWHGWAADNYSISLPDRRVCPCWHSSRSPPLSPHSSVSLRCFSWAVADASLTGIANSLSARSQVRRAGWLGDVDSQARLFIGRCELELMSHG